MEPAQLEADYFRKWEKKWRASRGKDINNPKIPVKYVRQNGRLVFAQERMGKPVYADLDLAPPLARPENKRTEETG